MPNISSEEKYRIGKSVTLWGIAVNFLLTAAKYLAGFAGRSQALVADATHSLGDLLTDFVTLWGLKYGRMPKDWNHPFGHGKIETLASSVIGMGLLCVGAIVGWSGIMKAFHGAYEVPTLPALCVAVVTGLSKEILFRYTYFYGQKINSKAVLANAYDHRSDAWSSLAAVIGIGGAMMGWPILDPLAAAVVSLFILKTGFTITMEAAFELAETSVSESVLKKINEVTMHAQGVVRVGDIRARAMGPSMAVEIDILVDPDLSVRQGHAICEQVEKEIQHHLGDVGSISVHVGPA